MSMHIICTFETIKNGRLFSNSGQPSPVTYFLVKLKIFEESNRIRKRNFAKMNEVTIISDVSALSADDLVTEYNKLANHYRNTKEYVEKCEQELFEVKRNMELSSKREKFLNQELESITEVHEKELIDATNKHNVEINHFRSRVAQAEQMIADSDAEIERMKEEMDAVSKDLKTKQAIQHDTTENTCVLSDSQLEYFGKLEKDQMNILQDLDTLKDKLKETVQQLARKEIELENLQDRFECSQENFRSKSHELDEKCQTVDSLQEKIVELTMALAEYKSGNNESSECFIYAGAIATKRQSQRISFNILFQVKRAIHFLPKLTISVNT